MNMEAELKRKEVEQMAKRAEDGDSDIPDLNPYAGKSYGIAQTDEDYRNLIGNHPDALL